ncbi:MAG: GTP pyrophosphokinase family protein [Lachnospiraceae bacterium]|nr:GTP pyrophosphokinase family protein [Lachnospiraceae bacterium]MDD6449121.1 GTP pyrophosphokinase family protein [Lachnospiraceae bacterium]MDD6450671.1 GTP pyrophosphokinase family protein [Lachnospiraceae bacterium]MDD6578880.1 GTP pyrophosphokinase family protein [Lachnospiraceae bacterium]
MNQLENIKQFQQGIIPADWIKHINLDGILGNLDEQTLPFRQMIANYQCAVYEVETKFKVLNERLGMKYDGNPIESIKSRVKSMESIMKKVQKKGLPLSVESIEENIRDIAGIRVICSFEEDVFRIAKYFLAQDDITLIEKKDYINNPKPNGYRSLHLIVQVPIFTEFGRKDVFVEVQIRTIAMDFWASLEHKLRYKKNLSGDQLKALEKELSICAEECADLDRRMEYVRSEIVPES